MLLCSAQLSFVQGLIVIVLALANTASLMLSTTQNAALVFLASLSPLGAFGRGFKVRFCLCVCVLISFVFQTVIDAEFQGAEWSDTTDSVHPDNYPLWPSLLLLLLETVVYSLIAVRAEVRLARNTKKTAVNSILFSVFCHCFALPQTPCCRCRRRGPYQQLVNASDDLELASRSPSPSTAAIEPAEDAHRAKIVLSGLTKTFEASRCCGFRTSPQGQLQFGQNEEKEPERRNENGDIIALDGVDLTVYEGQILALLGHNGVCCLLRVPSPEDCAGAGKTTLLSVMTGFEPADSGSATIYDTSLFDENGAQRVYEGAGISLCPQHNAQLFSSLTPRQHFEFYAAVKGVPVHQLQAVVLEMVRVCFVTCLIVSEQIDDMDLSDKADESCWKLSFGQQR